MSEELWNAVQAKITDVNLRSGAKRSGGLNRTEKSRSYLFSGLLVCGSCGSRIVIISGQGKRGYVRYGCPSHRYRGFTDAPSNGTTFEEQFRHNPLNGTAWNRLCSFRHGLAMQTLR